MYSAAECNYLKIFASLRLNLDQFPMLFCQDTLAAVFFLPIPNTLLIEFWLTWGIYLFCFIFDQLVLQIFARMKLRFNRSDLWAVTGCVRLMFLALSRWDYWLSRLLPHLEIWQCKMKIQENSHQPAGVSRSQTKQTFKHKKNNANWPAFAHFLWFRFAAGHNLSSEWRINTDEVCFMNCCFLLLHRFTLIFLGVLGELPVDLFGLLAS